MSIAANLLATLAQLLLATQVAKYGVRELGLQRPFNKIFAASLVLILLALYLGPTNIAFWGSALAIAWFVVLRYKLLLPGTLDYNVAVTRSNYWAQTHYLAGVRLDERGSSLRDFEPAQDALRRFRRAIREQSKLPTTPAGRCRIATAHQELALLLRMMNEFEAAEHEFQTALTMVSEIDDGVKTHTASLRALILLRLAEVHHMRNDARALSEFQESISAYAELGDHEQVSRITAVVKRLSSQNGDATTSLSKDHHEFKIDA